MWRFGRDLLSNPRHGCEADDDLVLAAPAPRAASARPARRPLAPRVAAPREPVDSARIGRRAVRRRAKGMDAGAVAVALEDARFGFVDL